MVGTIRWHRSKLVDMGRSLDGLEINCFNVGQRRELVADLAWNLLSKNSNEPVSNIKTI
jgi:hypothetical protein